MRQKKLFGLGMAVALMVVACGGGPTVEAANSPLGNSIAVHGDWTIEVHNPDGSPHARHDFSNAMWATAHIALSRILTGEREIVRWGVEFPFGSSPCDLVCALTEPDLIVETSEDGAVRLSGSITATRDGTINAARSTLVLCTPQATSCGFLEFQILTSADVAEVAVLEGQLIEFEVLISFTDG